MVIDVVRTFLTERAEAAGCIVEPLVHRYRYADQAQQSCIASRFLVNGSLCLISSMRRPVQARAGAYTRLSYATLMLVDAVIFHLALPNAPVRVYVVPSRALRAALFDDAVTRHTMCFFVPLIPKTTSRLCWEAYADAWHLLGRTQAA